MKQPVQHSVVPSAEAAAAIVARRRAAEKRALERHEARRQARLRAAREAKESRAANRFAPGAGFYAEQAMIPGALAELALCGVAKLAMSAARALRRAYGVRRETRAASVLGLPTAAELASAWVPPRRTLQQALLIGSKLVDLSAAHPDTRQWAQAKPGTKRRVAGRAGGLKQYFAEFCPTVRYSTAMRYRQLALRLLRVLDTPTAIPLEWLLSNADVTSLTGDATLAESIRDGRRKLWSLLADIRGQRELTRYLDRTLDPDRLPNARRGRDPVRDVAACEAVFSRHESRLREAVASGRSLSRDEAVAWALLKRLDWLSAPHPRP